MIVTTKIEIPQDVRILNTCAFCKAEIRNGSVLDATVVACRKKDNGSLEPVKAYSVPVCGVCYGKNATAIRRRRMSVKIAGIFFALICATAGIAAAVCIVYFFISGMPPNVQPPFKMSPQQAVLMMSGFVLILSCIAAFKGASARLRIEFYPVETVIKRRAETVLVSDVEKILSEEDPELKTVIPRAS
ncbi:MAG: hypothetical protein LBK58_03125 [Prevotellaceae bacterium]|jgi:hypothetical protein|nr:hypothetical protein [Prevotellaceae bacterium]